MKSTDLASLSAEMLYRLKDALPEKFQHVEVLAGYQKRGQKEATLRPVISLAFELVPIDGHAELHPTIVLYLGDETGAFDPAAHPSRLEGSDGVHPPDLKTSEG